MSSAPSTIKGINVTRLDIPLHVPFGIAGGVQAAANNVLVTVMLADGTRGLGEAAPLPAYNGETQQQAFDLLLAANDRVVGRDIRAWREIGTDFAMHPGPTCGSARCALETALLDAMCRHDRVPMWKFFGGAGTGLETDMTITTGTAGEARAGAAEIRQRGIRVIKVKIGGAEGIAADMARLRAIREAAPDAPLILDGNAGLTRDGATELVTALKAAGIAPALLEQWLPKDDLAGMSALARESGWAVAADESVRTVEDVARIADAGAAQIVNIKLMKAGIGAALDVAQAARARGLELMIGGNVESILGLTTSACFAAGLGGFRYADLDTQWFMAANPFAGGFSARGGMLSLAAITAGHGVDLGA
ncbi:MAG: dipeptide epimerase [Opitutaceae bacterium]|nr:dipeptide epimerase [Opitutaceae bacterium]